jgi:hypothetical protein
MGGAFQTSRDIFEHPIWQDIPKFRIFFFIVGNAVFSEAGAKVGGILVKRGQYLRSYRNLQDDLAYIENRAVKKYSLSVIKRKIDSLVKENRLKMEEAELGTLFTVVNYEQYQGLDNYKKDNLERSENAVRTEMERSWNNNKNVEEGKEGINVVVNNTPADEKESFESTDHIADYFMVKRGKPGQAPKVSDYHAIKAVLDAGVGVQEIINGIDRCFSSYKPENAGDSINSFNYCKKPILNNFYRNKARKEAKHERHTGRDGRSGPDEYEELSL